MGAGFMADVALAPVMPLRIGIAMLQGGRHEHAQAVIAAAAECNLEAEVISLRKSTDIVDLDCLILPGGESTTMRIASISEGLLQALFQWMNENPKSPVLGTCAGAIILCEPGNEHTSFLDASIDRNAWGRQADSFQAKLNINLDEQMVAVADSQSVVTDEVHLPLRVNGMAEIGDEATFPGVFIRAPRFSDIGEGVSIVASHGDEVVGVCEGVRMALTFHPELTPDRRFHRWLLRKCLSP